MRKALCAIAALAVAAPLSAQQVSPEVFTLDNGMKFLLLPAPTSRTSSPPAGSRRWAR